VPRAPILVKHCTTSIRVQGVRPGGETGDEFESSAGRRGWFRTNTAEAVYVVATELFSLFDEDLDKIETKV